MYLARSSIMAAACLSQINGSGHGSGSGNETVDPEEICSNVLHSTSVSVPQPSSSRTASDGKIKIFSFRRSRSSSSSSSKSSFSSLGGSIGSTVWAPAELYLTSRTVCYRLRSQGQVIFLKA